MLALQEPIKLALPGMSPSAPLCHTHYPPELPHNFDDKRLQTIEQATLAIGRRNEEATITGLRNAELYLLNRRNYQFYQRSI